MYKRILEFWMNERELSDLQIAPPGFREEVNRYLEKLGEVENGIPPKLREAEVARVKGMLAEIATLRRHKACTALASQPVPDENIFSDEPVGEAKPQEQPKAKGGGAKKILVRLLRDVPSFVGADLKTYGPLKSEDVILLPLQNADALIKRGIATEIQRKA